MPCNDRPFKYRKGGPRHVVFLTTCILLQRFVLSQHWSEETAITMGAGRNAPPSQSPITGSARQPGSKTHPGQQKNNGAVVAVCCELSSLQRVCQFVLVNPKRTMALLAHAGRATAATFRLGITINCQHRPVLKVYRNAVILTLKSVVTLQVT